MYTFSGSQGITASGVATSGVAAICNACAHQVAPSTMSSAIVPDQATPATPQGTGRSY